MQYGGNKAGRHTGSKVFSPMEEHCPPASDNGVQTIYFDVIIYNPAYR